MALVMVAPWSTTTIGAAIARAFAFWQARCAASWDEKLWPDVATTCPFAATSSQNQSPTLFRLTSYFVMCSIDMGPPVSESLGSLQATRTDTRTCVRIPRQALPGADPPEVVGPWRRFQ